MVCELAEQPLRWGGGTDTGAGGGGIVDSGGGTGRSSRWGLCTVSVGVHEGCGLCAHAQGVVTSVINHKSVTVCCFDRQ